MRKLALFAAGYAGAVFAATLILPGGVLLPLGGFCVLLAIAAHWILRGQSRKHRRCAVLCCAGAAVGLLWSWGYSQLFLEPARALDERTVVITGTVIDWPKETDYGGSILVRVDLEGGGTANTLLYIETEQMYLQPGDRIQTIAHCQLATHSNAGEEITYYTAKGIFLTAIAYGTMEYKRPNRIPLSCIPAWLSRTLKQSIDHCFPEDVSALIKALVTGNRDSLTDSYTTSLQRTGLSHVVAVSGMHLAFLAGLLSVLLGKGKRSAALITLPTIGLFTLVAGATPSVVRAAVMIALLQLAPLLGRERDSFTALAFALLVILVHNPYAAASVGLQLSFGAVAGILLFSDGLQTRLLGWFRLKKPGKNPLRWLWNGLVRFAVSVLTATLGASILTTPLTAFYFNRIALIAPISNLLTLWAVSAAFSGGLLVGVLGAFWPAVGGAAAWLVTPFARYLNLVVPFLSKLPFASIPMTTMYYRLWMVYLYVLIILAVVMSGRKNARVPVVCAGLMLAGAVLLTNLAFRAGAVTVQVLEVGQGQSVLIRSGSRFALVDCGGDLHENAGDIAADQIQALGQSELDLLVISHYHADHANGVSQLLERITVKRIALADVEPESVLRRRILEQAQRYRIPVTFITQDTHLDFGEDTIFTMYPPLGSESTNELGLTVLCSAGDFDLLLTGDMGTSVEKLLVEYADLPDVEMMVAGHHGSKYANSQLLLDTVKPDLAVFSVGRNNSYGHPTQEAAQRFASVGAQLYRTDRMGTVTVVVEPDLE